ncbi:MAG: hypothetical protein P8I94_10075 [Emcibacteraceae bacterium]|nr:hypothetical protein [Emcibacteraceae bacterium]
MKSLIARIQAVGTSPPRAPMKHILWSWLGSAFAIGCAASIAFIADMPFVFAPLGASAVLAFAVPDSPLACMVSSTENDYIRNFGNALLSSGD